MNVRADSIASRAIEENFWSLWSQFGRTPGATLHESATSLWFETPIPVPPYNAVIRFNGGADADREIGAIFSHFRARGVPFIWITTPSTSPGDIAARLKVQGFDEVELVSGMAAHLSDLPAAPMPPGGIELHMVTPEHDFVSFMELVAYRWHVPDEAKPHLLRIGECFRVGADGSPNRAWIAVKDGVALAKAFTHDGAGAVGLYGVATKPEARGLGLGHLVTVAALADAKARGHTVGVLHSTPMAKSLYERVGFHEFAPFRVFAAPNSFYA